MKYTSVRALVVLSFICVPMTTFGADSKSLCGPLPPQVDDTEVTWFKESDVSAERALRAINELEKVRNGGSDDELLSFANLKIIKGYALKYEAEIYKTPESVKKFCKWFFTEAWWPE